MTTPKTVCTEDGSDFAALRDVLNARGPSGAVVLGGSGMGKTTLVETVLNRVGNRQPAMRLQCSATLSQVPYAVLTPYLSGTAELGEPVHVLRELTTFLESLDSGTATPVVTVEDVHFLDPASSFVLSMLVNNAAIVLLAIGTGRIEGDSTLFGLTESGVLATVVVQPMDASQVRQLCEQCAGGPLTEGAVETILSMSSGNPGLVKAFVGSAMAQGMLVRQAVDDGMHADGTGQGPWLLARLAPEPDEELTEVVREMQESLVPGQRRTLELLALAGPLPRSILRSVAGNDHQHLLESGILARDREGLTCIAAEIYATVLRHLIAPGHSAELYRQWSAVADAAGHRSTGLQVLWALECCAEVDHETILGAAAGAHAELDYPLAWKLCSMANLGTASEAGALLESRTLIGMGRYHSARTILMRLVTTCTSPGTLQEALRLMALANIQLGAAQGDPDLLRTLWTDRGAQLGVSFPDEYAIAEGRQQNLDAILGAWNAIRTGTNGPGTEAQIEGILATEWLSTELKAVGLMLLADIHSLRGLTDTAADLTRRSMGVLDLDPMAAANYMLHVISRTGWNLLMSGRYGEAEEFLRARAGKTPRERMNRYGVIQGLRGIANFLQGNLDGAFRNLGDAAAELRLQDPAQLLPLVIGLRGLAAAERSGGRGKDGPEMWVATSAVEQLHAVPYRGARGYWVLAEACARIADGSLAQLRGRTADGTALRADADGPELPVWAGILDDRALDGMPLIERELLVHLPGRLDASPVGRSLSGRLWELARGMEGSRAAVVARMADSRAANDPVALADVAREARITGENSLAAEALARAALLHSDAGDPRRCGAILRELMLLHHETGGSPSAFVSGALALAELTSREQEIVDLANQGHNNNEIARILTLSQRTVEGHLYRVFSKLGITERSELAQLLLPSGSRT